MESSSEMETYLVDREAKAKAERWKRHTAVRKRLLTNTSPDVNRSFVNRVADEILDLEDRITKLERCVYQIKEKSPSDE